MLLQDLKSGLHYPRISPHGFIHFQAGEPHNVHNGQFEGHSPDNRQTLDWVLPLYRSSSNLPKLGRHLQLQPSKILPPLHLEAPFFIQVLVKWIILILAPVLVFLQPNGSPRTPAKSARDLLRTSFGEKMRGQHPKALYSNGTHDTRSPGREQAEAALGGGLAICGCQRGRNYVERLEIDLC